MNQYVFEEERPVVDTKCGKIRGIAYGGVNIFMGIDYAKAKRFQMPVEIEPWEGIKNAYQHGPISKQVLKLKPFYTYRGLHMLEEESEDCQNLNIWAPKGGAEKKPVFVWIHGGGFFGGNAFEEYSFEGANLARHGDIIFVSINHRLNILGHLNLDQYGEEFKDSPNVGIADLVVAMKWINENIAAFGGDPENVTICGHSGGGGKVQCLFQLKDAAPYFQRGIVLSGARSDEAYHLDDGTASRETAKKMMDYLGINKDNIQKVYDVPYEDLCEALKATGSNPFDWSPVPNDYFPGFPAEVGLMPFSKDKPIIYGSVLGEMPTVKLTYEEKLALNEDEEGKLAYLKDRYGDSCETLMELFRKAYPDHDILDLAYMDSRCRRAAVKSVRTHMKAGCNKVYNFLASYTIPEGGRIPIWHGGEVAYIFRNEDRVYVLNEEKYGQQYSETLSTMVLNFVRNGDPNCEYLPQWHPCEEDRINTMIIDRECREVTNHDLELVELFDKVNPKFVLNLDLK